MGFKVALPCADVAKMEVRTAGIVVVGDEVLKGQVADQNIHFLAKKLHLLGIKLCKVSIVPDAVADIAKEVAEYSLKYDRVITTGGIGPTHDDVTYEGIAAAFQDTLELNEELRSYWAFFNKDPDGRRLASSVKMATIPKSAKVVYSEMPKSIVPARKFPVVTVNNVVVFPGIPYYLQAIFNSLQGSYFMPSGVTFHVRRLYLNVFESAFSTQLTEAAKRFEKSVLFGSYPKVLRADYKTLITIEAQQAKDVDEAWNFFKNSLNEAWIVKDSDILSEAWSVTKERLNYDGLDAGFAANLRRSLEVGPSSLAVAVLWASAFDVKTSSYSYYYYGPTMMSSHRKRSPTVQQQPVMTDSPNRTIQMFARDTTASEGTLRHGLPSIFSGFFFGRPTIYFQLVEKVYEDFCKEDIFLAFNGGKDCTALLHLVHTVRNKLEDDLNLKFPPLAAVYFKPKNPVPEVESFIYQVAEKYQINLITEEGNIKDTLDRLTKSEVGKKWKVVLMGTRKADPHGKNLQHFQKTDEGWADLVRVSPILDWSYKEVWTYLRNFSVSYCSLYDEGYTSLDDSAGGCVPNPHLKYTDEEGKAKYRPAYTLQDETTERSGRR